MKVYIPIYYSIYKTNLKKFQFTLDSQMQDILNSYYNRMNKQILYDIAIYLISVSCPVSIFSFLLYQCIKTIKKKFGIFCLISACTKTFKELFGFCGIC